jgi:hypothetical protein
MKFATYAGMRIDRLASAWLIRRFIDPRARFRFIGRGEAVPNGWIAFDLPGVEYSHHGEDCTFETLVRKHRIRDRTVRAIARIVHDADLKDGKFGSPEAPGVNALVRGLGIACKDDDELLEKGLPLFDGLYRWLQGKGSYNE